MSYRIFSVGECPVCPGFGVVLVLATRQTSELVYFCPACGCAWRTPPQPLTFNESNSIDELAPGGVRLPLDAEIARLGGSVTQVDSGPWESDLVDILGLNSSA